MPLLQDLLDDLDSRTGFPREALIVGLGLLGETIEFERAVPDGVDHDAATAWALAVVLATRKDAKMRLEGGRRGASGPARRMLETALRRVRGDYVISPAG